MAKTSQPPLTKRQQQMYDLIMRGRERQNFTPLEWIQVAKEADWLARQATDQPAEAAYWHKAERVPPPTMSSLLYGLRTV